MRVSFWCVVFFAALLAACSERNLDQVTPATEVGGTSKHVPVAEDEGQPVAQDVAQDCPGFEVLFAMLPAELEGEPVSEHYVTCDAVSPTAAVTFDSVDGETFWTFSVTARDPNFPGAIRRWDLPHATDAQKAYLKEGLESVKSGEALMFEICVNNQTLQGLPEWHKTHQFSVGHYDICVGNDANPAEDGYWIGRSVLPEYMYTVKIKGQKALQFGNAKAASDYIGLLFTQFKS